MNTSGRIIRPRIDGAVVCGVMLAAITIALHLTLAAIGA